MHVQWGSCLSWAHPVASNVLGANEQFSLLDEVIYLHC